MASENIHTFTDTNFNDSVIKSSTPVLVDFWAEWCAPCRQLAPTVAELAVELDGRLTVGKLNVDENPSTAERFSVRGIPTLLIFKDGQVSSRSWASRQATCEVADRETFVRCLRRWSIHAERHHHRIGSGRTDGGALHGAS